MASGIRWQRRRERPLVLGHRGDSAHYPENTMVAFQAAMDAGADGFELDVHISRSDDAVVFHDDSLARLCGEEVGIRDLSSDELASRRVSGQPIPSLREVLGALPEALVNIELKSQPWSRTPALVHDVIEAVQGARAQERVVLSSFDPRSLVLLRVLAPNIPRGLLFERGQGLFLRRGSLRRGLAVSCLHPHHEMINEAQLASWHRKGYRVNTWTVDAPRRLLYLGSIGVDAVICNDPGAALTVFAV